MVTDITAAGVLVGGCEGGWVAVGSSESDPHARVAVERIRTDNKDFIR
jgi:hypothetical protein